MALTRVWEPIKIGLVEIKNCIAHAANVIDGSFYDRTIMRISRVLDRVL